MGRWRREVPRAVAAGRVVQAEGWRGGSRRRGPRPRRVGALCGGFPSPGPSQANVPDRHAFERGGGFRPKPRKSPSRLGAAQEAAPCGALRGGEVGRGGARAPGRVSGRQRQPVPAGASPRTENRCFPDAEPRPSPGRASRSPRPRRGGGTHPATRPPHDRPLPGRKAFVQPRGHLLSKRPLSAPQPQPRHAPPRRSAPPAREPPGPGQRAARPPPGRCRHRGCSSAPNSETRGRVDGSPEAPAAAPPAPSPPRGSRKPPASPPPRLQPELRAGGLRGGGGPARASPPSERLPGRLARGSRGRGGPAAPAGRGVDVGAGNPAARDAPGTPIRVRGGGAPCAGGCARSKAQRVPGRSLGGRTAPRSSPGSAQRRPASKSPSPRAAKGKQNKTSPPPPKKKGRKNKNGPTRRCQPLGGNENKCFRSTISRGVCAKFCPRGASSRCDGLRGHAVLGLLRIRGLRLAPRVGKGPPQAGQVLLTHPDRCNWLIKRLTLNKATGAAGVHSNQVRITATGVGWLTAFITIT